jgi:hypothetical protein
MNYYYELYDGDNIVEDGYFQAESDEQAKASVKSRPGCEVRVYQQFEEFTVTAIENAIRHLEDESCLLLPFTIAERTGLTEDVVLGIENLSEGGLSAEEIFEQLS